MSDRSQSRSNHAFLYWLPIILLVGFWFLYEATLAHRYTYDGLCYALDVEFARASNLFHPNHLLYSAFSWVLFQCARLVGYGSRAIYLMQASNALVAAIAVSLLYSTIASRYGWRRALVSALLLGFSSAYWSESVDPGCYAWAALACVFLVRLFFWTTPKRAFITGLLHGFLTLWHQMLLLVAPGFLFSLGFLAKGHRERWRACIAYVFGFALAYGIPYAIVAALFHRSSLHDALFWAFGPGGPAPGAKILSSYWWSLQVFRNMVIAWNSFAESLIVVLPHPIVGILIRIGIAALALWGVWKIARGWRLRNSSEKAFLSGLLIWIAILNIFQMFFYVGALRYRILFLAPLFVVLCAMVPPIRLRWAHGLATVLLLAVGYSNWAFSVRPAHQEDTDFHRTQMVRQIVGPNDFFLFAGRGPSSIPNVYMAYFGNSVRARSLSGYIFSSPRADMETLQGLLMYANASGGRIFAEKGLLDPGTLEMISEGGPSLGPLLAWAKSWKETGAWVGPDGYTLVELKP